MSSFINGYSFWKNPRFENEETWIIWEMYQYTKFVRGISLENCLDIECIFSDLASGKVHEFQHRLLSECHLHFVGGII